MCVRHTSFSAIFLLNKITVPIFQIIYIRNKTLNPSASLGVEQKCKVHTRLHGLFTFWHSCQREKKFRQRGSVRSELDERKLG